MSVATVLRLGFGIGGNAAFVLRLGFGSDAVPVPSAPATGAGDEINRRKWLEWRESKFRKKQEARIASGLVVRPTPVPAQRESVPIVDLAPSIRLLSSNIAAMRAQKDTLAVQEALRRRRLEEAMRDDEDALALLLED